MPYACKAATERNARCRHWAQDEDRDGFCTFHAGLRDSGKPVEVAKMSDTVLYKFNLNGRWSERLKALGVPVKQYDVQAKEKKHVAHAEAHGREAYAIRKNVADSGAQIFGPNGIQKVSLYETLKDLIASYEIVDIHIRPRRDGTRWIEVLVVSFSHGGKQAVSNQAALDEILDFLSASSWGFCHVWANPPQDDGRIIHTVNSSHREADKKPEVVLRLADGLWITEPASAE